MLHTWFYFVGRPYMHVAIWWSSSKWGTTASVLLKIRRACPEVSEVVSHLAFAFCPFLSLSSLSCPFPLSHSPLPFPPQGRRRGWSTGWASSSSCLEAHCLCATLFHCTLLRQVVLDGRDTAWVDIYSCFLRTPDSLEELGSSVGLSWMRDGGSGNGRKPVFPSSRGNSILGREDQVVEVVRRLCHDTWASESWGRFQLCAGMC